MRKVLASLIDAALTSLAGYLGFRVALWAAPCDGHMDNCFILIPLTVLFVLIGLALYLGLGYRILRNTPGRRLLGLS
jgi:uncharacterized RDD family membrane protein YckC